MKRVLCIDLEKRLSLGLEIFAHDLAGEVGVAKMAGVLQRIQVELVLEDAALHAIETVHETEEAIEDNHADE